MGHRAADPIGGARARRRGYAPAAHTNIEAVRSARSGTSTTARDAALMIVRLTVAGTKMGAFNLDDCVDDAGIAGIAVEMAGHDA